jgi:hypothetical protein
MRGRHVLWSVSVGTVLFLRRGVKARMSEIFIVYAFRYTVLIFGRLNHTPVNRHHH